MFNNTIQKFTKMHVLICEVQHKFSGGKPPIPCPSPLPLCTPVILMPVSFLFRAKFSQYKKSPGALKTKASAQSASSSLSFGWTSSSSDVPVVNRCSVILNHVFQSGKRLCQANDSLAFVVPQPVYRTEVLFFGGYAREVSGYVHDVL